MSIAGLGALLIVYTGGPGRHLRPYMLVFSRYSRCYLEKFGSFHPRMLAVICCAN